MLFSCKNGISGSGIIFVCHGELGHACVCSGVFSVCLLMLKWLFECAHAGQCESQLVLPSAFESEGGLVL